MRVESRGRPACLPYCWCRCFGNLFPKLGICLALALAVPGMASEPLRLTLDDAAKMALEKSPVLKGAQAEVEAAQARAGQEASKRRLTISATAVESSSDMGANLMTPPGIMPQNVFGLPARRAALGDLMAMYPLFTGGKLRAGAEAGRRLAASAAQDRAAMELDVIYGVRKAFWQSLLARALVDEYSAAADESRERVRIAEEKHKEGKIALYDLLRNRTDLAEAEREVNNAKRDLDLALIGLKLGMGVPAGQAVVLEGELASAELPENADQEIASALASRPEVLGAMEKVAAAEHRLSAVRALYHPQVYLSGMADAISTPGGSDSGYLIGVVASLPIVDGGMRKSEAQEAKAMLDRAKADLEQAKLRTEAEVRAAWSEVAAARDNASLAEAAVVQAEEDYRVVKLRYEAGKGINVELLDAFAAMVRAKTNRLTAIFDLNVAADAVARAVGVKQ